jgi:alpha-1,6-mannosyltransferase
VKFCDITMAYNRASGGIKTYIDEKRRFLRENTDHEHLLIIPGARDRIRRSARSATVTIRGPLLPGQGDYRFFLSPAKVKQVLMQEQPDIVELGSYYTEAWAAFAYRQRRREAGGKCLLGAYFHTDVAKAYVAAPLRAAAHSWLDHVSETLLSGAEMVAEVAALGAEKYIRHVFDHCDVAMAASPSQAARLREYGVQRVELVPMGVDLKLFHPRRRSRELRAKLGASETTTVVLYAGRLCAEKRTLTIVDAFRRLPEGFDAHLWLVGDGPLREDVEAAAAQDCRIRLLRYEAERGRFAELLASADVYVSAGPFETFGLSVIEAQACGLAVVGVDAGALRERVIEGLGLLGPVDDAEAMAGNIVRAAEASAIMGARARTHIAENFSWPRAFARLLECYGVRAAAVARAPAEAAAAP